MSLYKKSVIGIDISCSQIHFVEMSRSSQTPVIQKTGKVFLDKDVVKEGKVVNQDKLKNVLEELWKKNRIKSKEIILGISNNDIIMRFITLPKMPLDKLSNLIKFQVADYMPVNIDDYELDYTIISENANESGSYYNVLLVAAGKKMLYEFINAFSTVNSSIKDIKSSVLVMDKLVPGEYRNSVSVVVNLSSEACNLLIVNNNLPAFARTILLKENMHREIDIINKEKFSASWNANAGYSYRDTVPTENTKLVGISNTAVMEKEGLHSFEHSNLQCNQNKLILNIVSFVGDEIRSSISYFQSQNRDSFIEKIFLTGCACSNEAVYEGLADYLGMNVEILQPYENLFSVLSKKNKDKVIVDDYEPSKFAIALSLALHGLED